MMDTISIGFDDNGELVDMSTDAPETMDVVVLSPGRKVPFRW